MTRARFYRDIKSAISFIVLLSGSFQAFKGFVYYDNNIREINGHGYSTLSNVVRGTDPSSEVLNKISASFSDRNITPSEFTGIVKSYNRNYGGLEMAPRNIGENVNDQYPKVSERERLASALAERYRSHK